MSDRAMARLGGDHSAAPSARATILAKCGEGCLQQKVVHLAKRLGASISDPPYDVE
jgi:hypothetical protein